MTPATRLHLAALLALLLVGSSIATPRSAPEQPHTAAAADGPRTLSGAPEGATPDPEPAGAPLETGNSLGDNRAGASQPVAAQQLVAGTSGPTSTPALAAVTLQGTWAYADPAYGPHYLAIPNGPGWLVTVCGPAACLERVSTDAGPVLSLQREGRIGDLSAVDFEAVCGMTAAQRVAIGLCPGSFTITGRIRPPDTDTGGEP